MFQKEAGAIVDGTSHKDTYAPLFDGEVGISAADQAFRQPVVAQLSLYAALTAAFIGICTYGHYDATKNLPAKKDPTPAVQPLKPAQPTRVITLNLE